MSKKFVVTEVGEGEVPFLRGILVRSLVNSGLPFEDAYSIADRVRERFQDEVEVPRAVLRAATASLLKEHFGGQARDRYQAPPLVYSSPIIVVSSNQSAPFSEDRLFHSLQACAIEGQAAHRGVKAVHQVLRQRGLSRIHSKTLRHVVAQCLECQVSADMARRYLSWRLLKRSGTPMILLIGGITAAGKSTLATELRLHSERSPDFRRDGYAYTLGYKPSRMPAGHRAVEYVPHVAIRPSSPKRAGASACCPRQQQPTCCSSGCSTARSRRRLHRVRGRVAVPLQPT